MGKLSISAVVHTFNEETNIERCLRSLHFVDEIILVDMNSTDKTCELAKEYGAKIYTHPNMGFADPARNFGLSKVKGDWIVVLDADEELPNTLVHFLTKNINQDIDFFRIPRKNILFGKWIRHAGWWPDYQVRFFKKGYVEWTDKIHGVPITRGFGHDIDPDETLSITHYNYQSIEQFIQRMNRYSSIAAKELFLTNSNFIYSKLISAPIREFINRYFVWEGYKDGLHGLGLSFLQSFGELVIYLKLWELFGFKEQRLSLKDTNKLITEGYKEIRYWSIKELLKDDKNLISRLFLKIQRKINLHV